MLHHLTHTRTGSFFFLPVYRPIFAQHFRKFSGQVNQFIILVEILDVFRLCQSIVKSQFFLRQAQLFTVVMHYNPFAYVHSEKDILKLVTTLMTNTKGEGSGGDPFWEKSERLLLTALIAYLHDYILLDCTPSLGMLTINALAAADTALIPVQAQYLSAKGLEQLLQTINKVHRQINPKLKIEGILLTMTDNRTNYGRQIDTLIRQAYGKHIKVFGQTIPHSVRAAEISAAGKSIFVHDPKGKVAEAYKSLTKEVLADAKKQRKRQSEQLR